MMKKILVRTLLVLLSITLISWWIPAEAATNISPELKAQVLQIIRENPEVLIESVQAYQQKQQQEIQERRKIVLDTVKNNPQAVIAESPTIGATEGKILLVEFSDFQCPYCAQAHKTLKEFMAKHQDEVELVYKHFPLTDIHPQAVAAAKAAWAAFRQGKFWEYQDVLFSNQDKLGEEFYVETAKGLNLNVEEFNRDRNSPASDMALRQDMALGNSLGIYGTPFFMMNDELFTGAVKLSDMEAILDKVR
ncbi:MAG TPA: disulfide bond formation protein DsbA [Cyanobacteria bacterium UBA11149]|nr:disulfide bond formation protein DsbA [Cyanobacteria bacterium UBA11366]HBK62412.1 disulfide bond formation protein DsbA [Cyanobacteria bacterium UBA11166]HBR75109.1 disulfide bond formation protein DsbA [Cyanobacteria bacterium UBA11159]HBS70537.1 disulfide bond formation protein DsbA [Cyanobacteria bacterium UBA11153]HBW90454.1 disulfide bond formation protein DsbA [Cyanobacteria bacterium UBA11149]HCA96462.1 disulfide bond formation protein DsbA [Cyanobacteria bacterium UBA9226]